MKKILLSFCICLFTVAGAAAQNKGDMAVGLNLGAAPCLEKGVSLTNFGIGAKYQYNVTNHIRLEADVDYWFKSKGIDMLDISANVHYLFKINDKFRIYPLVGVGYARVGGYMSVNEKDIEDYFNEYFGRSYDDDDDDDSDVNGSSSANKLIVNAGLGAEYNITKHFAIGIEVKYQYAQHFSRLPITIGATYNF